MEPGVWELVGEVVQQLHADHVADCPLLQERGSPPRNVQDGQGQSGLKAARKAAGYPKLHGIELRQLNGQDGRS